MARYFALVFVVLLFALAVWSPIAVAQEIEANEKTPRESKENDHKDDATNNIWNTLSMIIATPFEQIKTNKDENNTISSGKVETFGILLTTFNATNTLPASGNDVRDTNKKHEENVEDEFDLYAKILAKKLKKYPESMRVRLIYKIDGLLLNNPYPEITSNGSTETPNVN
ncbi:uncharacterized protein LOC115443506 [Manduca sexta]|uniref:uncharacterized protein LOC115443506 n=1 Tax=Manduca sexta TaxID=7130 RepID=UPI00188ED7A3|nr:uncharacterized protein LOC115443506 [Manduca sexta]